MPAQPGFPIWEMACSNGSRIFYFPVKVSQVFIPLVFLVLYQPLVGVRWQALPRLLQKAKKKYKKKEQKNTIKQNNTKNVRGKTRTQN